MGVDSERTTVTKVKALWAYEPTEEHELAHLSFPAGALIDVLVQYDKETGWWEGAYEGKQGMFPINRTQVYEVEKQVYKKIKLASTASKKILDLQRKIKANSTTAMKSIISKDTTPKRDITNEDKPVLPQKQESNENLLEQAKELSLDKEEPPTSEEVAESESESEEHSDTGSEGSESESEELSDTGSEESEGEITITEEELEAIRQKRAHRRAQSKGSQISDAQPDEKSESDDEPESDKNDVIPVPLEEKIEPVVEEKPVEPILEEPVV